MNMVRAAFSLLKRRYVIPLVLVAIALVGLGLMVALSPLWALEPAPLWVGRLGAGIALSLLCLPIAQVWWIVDCVRGPFRPVRFATIWVACVPPIAVMAAAVLFGRPAGGAEMVFFMILWWIGASAALCILGGCVLTLAAAVAPAPRELAEAAQEAKARDVT